jgi:hypothetical protein
VSDFPNPRAAAYAGAGPHLAVAGELIRTWDGLVGDLYFRTTSLPDSWRAYDDQNHKELPAQAQLVICLGLQKRGDKAVGLCGYDTKTASVYPSTHIYEVYEAKTGRRVTTFTIPSDLRADLSCPPSFSYFPGAAVEIPQGVKDETLHSLLSPLILGPAR